MSDGQTFLLILFLFYFLECCVLVKPGSRVFVRGFNGYYSPRTKLLDLGGLRKEFYFLFFFPWPGRAFVFPPEGADTRALPSKLPSYGRYLARLQREGSELALRGLMLWLIFFLFIPILYYLDPWNLRVFLFVAIGYLLMIWQSVRYHCLHHRFFPERGEERLKQTLYLLFFPWHGMRAGEYLTLRPRLDLQRIAIQSLLLEPSKFKVAARLAWRKEAFGPRRDEDRLQRLEAFLEGRGQDVAKFADEEPGVGEEELFCPVCHVVYSSSAEQCADCGGVELRRPRTS